MGKRRRRRGGPLLVFLEKKKKKKKKRDAFDHSGDETIIIATPHRRDDKNDGVRLRETTVFGGRGVHHERGLMGHRHLPKRHGRNQKRARLPGENHGGYQRRRAKRRE